MYTTILRIVRYTDYAKFTYINPRQCRYGLSAGCLCREGLMRLPADLPLTKLQLPGKNEHVARHETKRLVQN